MGVTATDTQATSGSVLKVASSGIHPGFPARKLNTQSIDLSLVLNVLKT